MVDDLKSIPEKFPHVDLMLIHLGQCLYTFVVIHKHLNGLRPGGTSIPGPNMPLLMVTMNAAQGRPRPYWGVPYMLTVHRQASSSCISLTQM